MVGDELRLFTRRPVGIIRVSDCRWFGVAGLLGGQHIDAIASCPRSRTKQGKRDHRNSVASAIGRGPGTYDHHVDQIIAQVPLEPQQVTHVMVVDLSSQFHPKRNIGAIPTMNDEVHLTVHLARSELTDARLVGLRVGLKAERDQRFKKPPEDRAVLWVQHLHGRGGQELLFIHAQEPGQDRIGSTSPLAEFSLRL